MYFLLPKKSSTCFSRSGNPLSEFNSFEEAQASADYEKKRNGDCDLVPYECMKCLKFHLKPKEFYVPKLSTKCSCRNTEGKPKDAYPLEDAAQKMAEIRGKSGVRLFVYRCPDGNGWHLTSHPF